MSRDTYPIPKKSLLQYIVDGIVRWWDNLDKDTPYQWLDYF